MNLMAVFRKGYTASIAMMQSFAVSYVFFKSLLGKPVNST